MHGGEVKWCLLRIIPCLVNTDMGKRIVEAIQMKRLEEDLIDLFSGSLEPDLTKTVSSDAVAQILVNRLLLPDGLEQFKAGYNCCKKTQVVKGKILDSLFSYALREKIKQLLDKWDDAQQVFFSDLSVALIPNREEGRQTLIPTIERYVTEYQRLLYGLMHLLQDEGSEDLFNSVDGASAMELVLNYGCEWEQGQCFDPEHPAYVLIPTPMAPQILEAILRVCHDCSTFFRTVKQKATKSFDNTEYFLDLIESIVLALKNLDVRTFYNKKVYQFSVRYDSQGALLYLGKQAGRLESYNDIPPIRLLEKIWYLIYGLIDDEIAHTKLNIHLIGRVQHERLGSLSRLLYAVCFDEARKSLENNSKQNESESNEEAFAFKLSKIESIEIMYTIHCSQHNDSSIAKTVQGEVCQFKALNESGVQLPKFVFTVGFEDPVNLKKVADIRRLFDCFQDDQENPAVQVFFILDAASLYSLADELERKSRSRVLAEFGDPNHYQYGETTSTVANGRNAKSGFQELIRWLSDQCARPILHKDLYNCSADLTVLNRIRSVIADKTKGQKACCYLFYSNNEAIFSSELSDLNIARLELYNGYRTGVIRIADSRDDSGDKDENELRFIGKKDEYIISLNLWQLLKSISSEICQFLIKYAGFNDYVESTLYDNLRFERCDNQTITLWDQEAALIYLLKSVYIGINYSGLCDQGKAIEIQLVLNRNIFKDSAYSFDGFLKKIEALANSILVSAIAPEQLFNVPLDHMKREAMIRAIYGRAQTVEDIMLYSLYVNNPEWLLGKDRRVKLKDSLVCVGEKNEKIYYQLHKLYLRSSFQHLDKGFYAYRMITGDFGQLTSLDRQLIRRVANANDRWSTRNDDGSSYDTDKERLISWNIRRSCESFGYLDTPLYRNYSSDS